MDFIILKSDGSLQKQSLTRYIQQGSHGVDEIFIGWANATSSHILQAVFTLPNKLTNTELGTFESDYEYEPGETINGWVITLTENQTRYNGLLMVSARIILNGIVQVAYPFALCINETGVRPETDSGVTLEQLDSYLLNIQTLITGAVQQNTDAALSSTSENPVQNKVITNAIETLKRGSYTKVDTTEYPTLQDFLDTEGEEGYLYLYPVNTSDEDEGYYQYIWENDLWIPLGTTKIDIANMVTTDTPQEITANKTFSGTNIFKDKIYVTTPNEVSGLSYGLRIRNNGWTSDIQQEGGANLQFGGAKIVSNVSFVPGSDNQKDLGENGTKWKDLYLSGSATLSSIKAQDGNEAIKFSGTATSVKWLYPYTTNTYNLGSSTLAWKDLYLTGELKDNNNHSIKVADIGKKLYKHTIVTDGGGGADLFIISTRSIAYTLPIDWLSLNTDAIKVLYNGCLVLRIYESSGNYYAQYINDSNTITNSTLGATTIEDTVAEL